MGGIVKGVKKLFKAVGSFVKKYWKVIVIAAAIYFTCGLAAGAMAPAATGAVAAESGAVAAGAGYAGTATAVAAGAEAGSMTAALGITTAAGYGAGAAAMTAAEFTAAGGVAAGVGLAASEAGAATVGAGALAAESGGGMPGITSSLEGTGYGAADTSAFTGAGSLTPDASSFTGPGAETAGTTETGFNQAALDKAAGQFTGDVVKAPSLLDKGVGAVKGFWGGMSTGEKLMFASTAFNAISGALKEPTRAEQGLWPGGAYFGMDDKGNKTDLAGAYSQGLKGNSVDGTPGSGTTPPATAATAQPQQSSQPGSMDQSGGMDVAGSMASTGDASDTTQSNALPTAASGTASGSSFLPAAGSGAANLQRSNQQGQRNLAEAATKNEKFFDDLRDRLDANHA